MIATRGFVIQGEVLQSFSPLSVLVYIVVNIAVRPGDCLKGQLAQR